MRVSFSEYELVLFKIFFHEINELLVTDLTVVIHISLLDDHCEVKLLENVEDIFMGLEDAL